MDPQTAPPGPYAPPARMPRQIPFIIASEGCERFSFYGMRNILTPFLVGSLFLYLPKDGREGAAKEVFHTFVLGVYFFPLLGGWIADRFFGKFNTVFWLSLVYCVGHGLLAVFDDNRKGFYAGLFLIALGSGGIKPLVASFVGDQFDKRTKHLAKLVFDGFYWIVNFGSFFASLLMPIFLRKYGASVAFGIPGALMLIATVVLVIGRPYYVMVPPAPSNPHSFLRVTWTALMRMVPGKFPYGLVLAIVGLGAAGGAFALVPKLGWVAAPCLALVALIGFAGAGTWIQLDRARGTHPDEAVEGVRAVLRVLVVFALVTPFWSLFDQKASTWVLAGNDMTKPSWFAPAQMQALNPALVMILIPFNNLVVYPALRRAGLAPTALARMSAGVTFAGLAWIAIGCIQLALDDGHPMSIVWQILPYALLTFGEVLVAATGLEFAYSQAPLAMKGVIMSFWNLAVTVGNLWVLVANSAVRNRGVTETITSGGWTMTSFLMFFFAAFAFVAAIIFGLYARSYREIDNYRV
jgi:proton-dependent oligopeptide transporter, POT family